MELDVHHLRLVRAIGETGSLSEAAVALGVTQPAVSGTLKRLENALGQRLFERGRATAVTPTPTGELLLSRIAAVLPLMEGLVRDIETRARPNGSTMRVGGVCSPIVGHLPGIVADRLPSGEGASLFDSDCPDLVIDLVAQRRLELGLIKEYPGFEAAVPSSVEAALIAVDPTMVVLPEDHPLARQKVVRLEQLADAEWVLPVPDSSRFHEYFRHTCRAAGFDPRARHFADNYSTTVAAVRSGAVGLSQAVCEGHQQVAVRLLADEALVRRFLLLWHREGAAAPHAREVFADVTAAYRAECRASPVFSRYLG
ncbi:LysR family transcriptional regulator [Kibdelosporangium persicum]|uniref:DNA-binding transcriptional LysR family regulator n=1 Tax=Kibdelosporangium persicum TaxID=2698649 RepID=A0ABX2F9W3_9PSEU|nr:LysR family transcriptional regulator [Kibdelosporangium persicum]NRN67919.1 DNA-binding transcriptional LysR family regulator [Kibdelosporangium persicum]